AHSSVDIGRRHRHSFFPYTTLFRSKEPDKEQERKRLDQDQPSESTRCGLFGNLDVCCGTVVSLIKLVHLRDEQFARRIAADHGRSEEHTSELQSRENLVCRLLLEKN